MGSDSRTATATSSKPRPKWRDRHLNQLSNDQLQEVKAHRNDSAAQIAENQFDDTQPLQQQAGRDDSHHESRPQMRNKPTRAAETNRPARSARYRSDERGDERQRRPGVNREQRRTQKEAMYRKSDDQSAKYSAGSAVQPTEQAGTEKKESGFARLLKFKVSRPVKWGLMALAIVCLLTLSFMKPIDNSSQSQLDSALTRAMIGFGLARTLNGVISVAQGTEFAVQPAGVGVNFSPGEILDPVNDLVERFSWVMLLATSSLGVQKILLEVSSWMGISLLLGGAGLFFLANDWVYHKFLEPRFEQSSQELEIASDRIREISTRQTQPEKSSGSLADRAKNLYNSMTSKFDFDGMLNDYRQSAENVSEHAVNLIVVFVLQTVLFPLLWSG